MEYVPKWKEHRPEDPDPDKDGKGVLARLNKEVGERVAHPTVDRCRREPHSILPTARALYSAIGKFLAVASETLSASRELPKLEWANEGFKASAVAVTHTSSEPDPDPFGRTL